MSDGPKKTKEPTRKANSVSFFFDPPYGLKLSTIAAMPEINSSEVNAWVGGDRFLACKLYRNRTKIKDMQLIAWLFMSLSYVAHVKLPSLMPSDVPPSPGMPI